MRIALTVPALAATAWLASAVPAAADAAAWRANFDSAVDEARERSRPLLVDFMAVWCQPCRQMEHDVFAAAAFVAESERFVPVHVNIDQQPSLADRFGAYAIPLLIVADPWGTVLFRRQGYVKVDDVMAMMRAVPADFSGLSGAAGILERTPDDFDALLAAGRFYSATPLHHVEREFLLRATKSPRAKSDPAAASQAQLALGAANLRAQDYKEAEKIFTAALKTCGADTRGMLLVGLGTTLAKRGDAKKARRCFETVVAEYPDSDAATLARRNLALMR